MTGGFWIASYIVLCLTVLLLVLGVLALFRAVGDGREQAGPPWPMRSRLPGQQLGLAELASNERSVVILTTPNHDTFATVLSAAAVAQERGLGIHLVVRGDGSEPWEKRVLAQLDVAITHTAPSEFDELGLVEVPVVSVVENGVVIDAASRLVAPSAIEERFRLSLRSGAQLRTADVMG